MNEHLTRRRFLEAAGGGVLSAAMPGAVHCATRPKADGGLNVLFLMTDEQHWRSLSRTGNPYIETPHMDRLAAEGVATANGRVVVP